MGSPAQQGHAHNTEMPRRGAAAPANGTQLSRKRYVPCCNYMPVAFARMCASSWGQGQGAGCPTTPAHGTFDRPLCIDCRRPKEKVRAQEQSQEKVPKPQPAPKALQRTYECATCLQTFVTKALLRDHQDAAGHLPATAKPKSSKCSYCERYFPTKEKCDEHEAKVHVDKPAPFKCAYCQRGFAWSITRVKHEQTCTR